MANGALGIPRTKQEFAWVTLDQAEEPLTEKMNNLGALGFQVQGEFRILTGKTQERFLLMVRSIGVEIIGPGLLG